MIFGFISHRYFITCRLSTAKPNFMWTSASLIFSQFLLFSSKNFKIKDFYCTSFLKCTLSKYRSQSSKKSDYITLNRNMKFWSNFFKFCLIYQGKMFCFQLAFKYDSRHCKILFIQRSLIIHFFKILKILKKCWFLKKLFS